MNNMKNNIIKNWLKEHGDPEIDKKVKKQLELEEVLPKNRNGKYSRIEIEKAFELGAKWQAETMYTEEDMKTAMLNVIEFTEFQKNEFRKNNDYHMALDIIHAVKQETLEQ